MLLRSATRSRKVGLMYTGKVTPGGAPDVRELADLIITKMSVGEFDNNTYLLRCRRTDEQVLVDAAAEPDRILTLIGDGGLSKIVTTHQHGDHWQALAHRASATRAATDPGAHHPHRNPLPTDRAPGDRR